MGRRRRGLGRRPRRAFQSWLQPADAEGGMNSSGPGKSEVNRHGIDYLCHWEGPHKPGGQLAGSYPEESQTRHLG